MIPGGFSSASNSRTRCWRFFSGPKHRDLSFCVQSNCGISKLPQTAAGLRLSSALLAVTKDRPWCDHSWHTALVCIRPCSLCNIVPCWNSLFGKKSTATLGQSIFFKLTFQRQHKTSARAWFFFFFYILLFWCMPFPPRCVEHSSPFIWIFFLFCFLFPGM